LIVNLAKVKHGLVFVRMEAWHGPNRNERTANWKCENGKMDCPAYTKQESGTRQLAGKEDQKRKLGDANEYCDDWRLEFAIDGKVTSWTLEQFQKQVYGAQRVVHLSVFLDDPNYTGGEEKDVEFAIRMTGCARGVTFALSHIYWM